MHRHSLGGSDRSPRISTLYSTGYMVVVVANGFRAGEPRGKLCLSFRYLTLFTSGGRRFTPSLLGRIPLPDGRMSASDLHAFISLLRRLGPVIFYLVRSTVPFLLYL